MVSHERNRGCRSRVFNTVGVAVIIAGGAAVFFHERDPHKRLGFGIMMLAIVAAFVWSWTKARAWERRVRKLLGSRPPMDATSFAEAYFRDVPHGQECAVAVHRQLEEHIGIDMSGLRPDDTLGEIHAQLDPVYFSYLGEELGIRFPTTSSREFTSMMSSLVTVRDLVEFAAQLVSQKSNES